jgi:hypothetical protein
MPSQAQPGPTVAVQLLLHHTLAAGTVGGRVVGWAGGWEAGWAEVAGVAAGLGAGMAAGCSREGTAYPCGARKLVSLGQQPSSNHCLLYHGTAGFVRPGWRRRGRRWRRAAASRCRGISDSASF